MYNTFTASSHCFPQSSPRRCWNDRQSHVGTCRTTNPFPVVSSAAALRSRDGIRGHNHRRTAAGRRSPKCRTPKIQVQLILSEDQSKGNTPNGKPHVENMWKNVISHFKQCL